MSSIDDRLAGTVLGAATLTTGLMAGLFYAFDVSVMPGLSRTDDRTFVTAMRSINEAIENPLFAVTYSRSRSCMPYRPDSRSMSRCADASSVRLGHTAGAGIPARLAAAA